MGEPEEYAVVAEQRGLRGLIVTCHNPMPNGYSANVRMSINEFSDYVALVERAKQAWAGRIDICLGLEADYFPGHDDWLKQQLDSAPFHYVLGSVHPQTPEFRQRYRTGDPLAYQRTYFDLLADASETRLFDCLAHPDLVKNETAGAWYPEEVMDHVLAALDRIAATGVAMELNTSGAYKVIPQMNPFPQMLAAMNERSIPVVIGADAHKPCRVADRFEEALALLDSCGYHEVSFYLDRHRQVMPIAEARASLCPTNDSNSAIEVE